jgi:hypothetical protein
VLTSSGYIRQAAAQPNRIKLHITVPAAKRFDYARKCRRWRDMQHTTLHVCAR